VLAGLAAIAVLWLVVVALCDPANGLLASAQDARSYHALDPSQPYAGRPAWGSIGAFPYSPAFALLVWPIGLLPWPLFVAAWTALLLVCAAWLTGPQLLLVGVLAVAPEVMGGNIALLMTVAIVVGLRWPAAWALILLTKVTPGVGLLWFVVRREWGSLAVALGATCAIAGISFLLAPDAWPAWITVLGESAGGAGTWAAVPVPLAARLPLAILLVTWGARTDRSWTVPVAAMLALPALWYGSLAMLLGVVALRRGSAADRTEGCRSPVVRIAGPSALFAVRERPER
jgi:hypothetical protein